MNLERSNKGTLRAQIRRSNDGGFSERFFILTHEEICRVQAGRNQAYAERYFQRHGKPYDVASGVDNVTVADVEKYEDHWSKIADQLGRGER